MDYAGGFPADHSIHQHIAGLETGCEVFLIKGKRGVEIQDHQKCSVAKLSNQSSEIWCKRLAGIHQARVLCMINRNAKDPDESFAKRIKTDSWELPLLEVVSKTKFPQTLSDPHPADPAMSTSSDGD